jgi:hypothetical protein
MCMSAAQGLVRECLARGLVVLREVVGFWWGWGRGALDSSCGVAGVGVCSKRRSAASSGRGRRRVPERSDSSSSARRAGGLWTQFAPHPAPKMLRYLESLPTAGSNVASSPREHASQSSEPGCRVILGSLRMSRRLVPTRHGPASGDALLRLFARPRRRPGKRRTRSRARRSFTTGSRACCATATPCLANVTNRAGPLLSPRNASGSLGLPPELAAVRLSRIGYSGLTGESDSESESDRV